MTKPMAAPVTAPSGPSDAAFAEAHRQLLADRSIQFQLQPPDPPEPPPAWLEALGRLLAAIWPVLEVVFWVALAAGVLWILYLLAMRLAGREWRWGRRAESGADESWRPDEEPARALLAEADVLAGAGRFSEAARLLLFRSIEDIESRRPQLLRPALTSRDIAELAEIPERPRGAFARIAALVERGLFARIDLGESDWGEARAAYEQFAFAGAWRA